MYLLRRNYTNVTVTRNAEKLVRPPFRHFISTLQRPARYWQSIERYGVTYPYFISLFQEIMGKLVKRYIFDAKRDDEEGNQEQWVNRIKQDISGFKYEMFEALSGMDKKMADMESRIVNGELAAEPLGTDMFHAMEEAVKKPLSRPDSMQSVKSGCSDACGAPITNLKDSKSSCFSPPSVWDDGSMELPSKANRYKPKSPSMPANIAAYQYPPDWERYQPILYIDEDPEVPLLGSPRQSIKRRRHSASQLNHLGINGLRRKSLRENTTKV